MQQASEKKKRERKNPKVSVRLNVRPLRGNWKAVKRTECNGGPRTRETVSPAEEQLDGAVWKTKNVRTDIVDSIAVNKNDHKDYSEQTDVVPVCDCEKCEKAEAAKSALELSPKEYRENLIMEKKSKKAKSSKSKASSKQRRRHRRNRSLSASSKSISSDHPLLLAPPNSEASPATQQHWCKLYEEARHPVKLIDPKKIHTVPGQIGMSDLEPEDPETPPPTANELQDAPRSHSSQRSSKIPIMNPVVMSPVSEMYNISPGAHQPPLVPQPPVQSQPNVVILPAPVEKSAQDKKPFPPPGSESNSSLVFMPSSPAAPEHATGSTSKVSMIRKMENIFYNSESNWWFLVALIMLTIFAYRSSIEQHTCYYD